MFSKITKLNDYDKVTLIYEPTVQAKQQKSKVLTYLAILTIAIFLLGVNFAFHFLRYSNLLPPPQSKHSQINDHLVPTIPKKIDCPKKEFDYLQLTVRWPPSFCKYQKCRKGANMYNWDIHGLWPDFKDGTFPQFCCENYKFDINELKPIQSELETYWQDLITEGENSEHQLWTHEWNKHGTCTMINPRLGTIFNYFNTTLSLFKKYRIQNWLDEENILPNKDEPFKLDRIRDVIQSRFNGKKIKIECDKYTHTKVNCDKADYSDGQAKNCTQIKAKTFKLIDSIDLCFDKMTLEPIDCPQTKAPRKIVCDKDVYYIRTRQDAESLKF